MVDITRYWYRSSLHPVSFLLLPFSWLFAFCSALRRFAFNVGWCRTVHFPQPVIVVGNITAGGTGKTPFVIWLVQTLQAQGYRPAIVSRGVGGKRHAKPYWVQDHSKVEEVGDEAKLLFNHLHCPLVVHTDRVAAVQALLRQSNCNVIISDDGLQHYRLGRVIEIAIVDGERRFGNQQLLPAGPLREPIKRLKKVDMVVINGKSADELTMTLEPTCLINLKTKKQIALAQFSSKRIHGVAGIGNPGRFFQALNQAGFDVITHAFPDHHPFTASDFQFATDAPIVMTEKDAVKCEAFATEQYWYVAVTTVVDDRIARNLLSRLSTLEVQHEPENDFASFCGGDSYSVQRHQLRK